MTIPRLAYIVQLDLPGHPIKIGCTKNPWSRFDAFSHGTPVACRYVGLTIDGIRREKAMLAATIKTKIKGEWRYPTPELIKLVRDYYANREWFTFAPETYDGADIRSRILAIAPENERYLRDGRRPSPRSVGYAWVNAVLAQAETIDPLLGVHWAGFHHAAEPPSFQWPNSPLRVAA